MKFFYYKEVSTGKIIHCDAIPPHLSDEWIDNYIKVFNDENKSVYAGNIIEAEGDEGKLLEFLVQSLSRKFRYERAALEEALSALSDATEAIQQLEPIEEDAGK